jgi:hypothetical protein
MEDVQIIADLRSGDLELQAVAVDEAVRVVKTLMSESVRTLVLADSPFAVASKLLQFGPLIIPMLEDVLEEPMRDDARNHVAALLLELGSAAGVAHLLSLLEHRDQNAVMAALVLGKARVREAAQLIRGVLENWDCASDPYSAATLIDALKRLDAISDSLRESIRQRWPRQMNAELEKLLR